MQAIRPAVLPDGKLCRLSGRHYCRTASYYYHYYYLCLEGIRDTYLYQHTFEPTRGRMSNEPRIWHLISTADEYDIIDIKNLSPLEKSDQSVLEFKLNCMSIEELSTFIYISYCPDSVCLWPQSAAVCR